MAGDQADEGADAGTALTRFNALKHGVLSKHTLLPWEDDGEYRALLDALTAEHAPIGPTEEHLVEELAGIIWRKRRLRLAEAASGMGSVASTTLTRQGGDTAREMQEAIETNDEDIRDELADLAEDEAHSLRALERIQSRGAKGYDAALAELHEDSREWWLEECGADAHESAGDADYRHADADGLRAFLTETLLPWYEKRREALARMPAQRERASGAAVDTFRLEKLGRYEVHLDRKLERTLSMLLKLQQLRAAPIGD